MAPLFHISFRNRGKLAKWKGRGISEVHRLLTPCFLQPIPLPQSLSIMTARTPTAAAASMSGSIPVSHRNGWKTLSPAPKGWS